MPDILDTIVTRREIDYQRLGPSFGMELPALRQRGYHPFLAKPGVILEIKRASPSRGPIAMDLDPVSRAKAYADAGAKQISILTESHFFKGSLEDLVAVASQDFDVALLRKDFLQHEDEIDVSWRAGADAVLLIARILPLGTLSRMCRRCRELGMTPFVEVREEQDLEKLDRVCAEGTVVAGVNSRDLRTFRTDMLVPALMRKRISCKAVFESGATDPRHAVYAGRLGFDGLLVGEAVSRDAGGARRFVKAFSSATSDRSGEFWCNIASRKHLKGRFPLVKICGLTNLADAKAAAAEGADLLGFIFAKSPRAATADLVLQCRVFVEESEEPIHPLLIGVVTSLDDEAGRQALRLAETGVLDALQLHGSDAPAMLEEIDRTGTGIGRYAVVSLGSAGDVFGEQVLIDAGEPRVLCDAKVGDQSGGTGTLIADAIMEARKAQVPLWLAGGLGPDNIHRIIMRYRPELIDASSSLESEPGRKDIGKLRAFFKEVSL